MLVRKSLCENRCAEVASCQSALGWFEVTLATIWLVPTVCQIANDVHNKCAFSTSPSRQPSILRQLETGCLDLTKGATPRGFFPNRQGVEVAQVDRGPWYQYRSRASGM